MFFNFLLDLLFPPHCVACGSFGPSAPDGRSGRSDWWCRSCRDGVDVPRTALSLDGFERIDCTGLYHDPLLRNAIHALKYRGCTAIRPAMVEYLRDRGTLIVERGASVAIQPLPADPARVRDRGFDHAAFLAKCLAEALGVTAPIADLLERRRGHGIAQATLEDAALRSANVHGAFRLKPGAVVPHSILLVDDVITTGATMKEAATILRAAGVQKISAFALAMGK